MASSQPGPTRGWIGATVSAVLTVSVVGAACAAPAAAPAATAATPTRASAASSYKPAKPFNPPVVVTSGEEGLFLDAPLVVADEMGFFKDEGIELKTIHFTTATESFPPLTTGQIDLKVGSLSPVLFNSIARGIDIKVVSEAGYAPGYAPMGLLVRTDLVDSGKYKTPADLKGMKIGVPSRYGLTEYFLTVMLEKEGLSIKDVDVVAAGTGDALAALAGKSIDAAINVEPFVSQGERLGMAKVPVRADKVVPTLPTGVMMLSQQFYAKKDVAQAFVTAWLRGSRLFAERWATPQGQKEMIELLGKRSVNMTADSQIAQFPRNGKIDVQQILPQVLTWLKGVNVIQGEVDLNKVVDHSFVDKANELLGP